MTAFNADVRELSSDEVSSVHGGDCVNDGERTIGDDVRDIADFIKGLIKGFSD